MLVAVYVKHHWTTGSLIGMVMDIHSDDIDEETFVIHWYGSSWSGKCFPLYEGGGANRKLKTIGHSSF
jgi:hypothetical protein